MRVLRWRSCAILSVCVLTRALAGSLTIATYNLENYTSANRLTEFGYRRDYPKPETEKDALRATLRELDADVIVFQEIGSAAYLEELQRDLRTEGVEYPHAWCADAHDPDRRLAVLSRVPWSYAKAHGDLAFRYFGETTPVKRGLLEMRFATPLGEVALFAVHLKSRYSDRSDDPGSEIRRNSEATVIRDRILQLRPDPERELFLVLGDFNDGRHGRAMQRFLKKGKLELAISLPAADSRGHTWTHAYRKKETYSRVDHVLVSPALFPSVREGRARIFDGERVAAASDHRPVVATIEWRD